MIRAIAEKDLPQCAAVIRESFLTVAGEFGLTEDNAPRFTAFAVSTERLSWQFHQEHRPMFGCFYEGALAGYYSLFHQEGDAWELNNLCVLPAFRHQGLGARLLEHAIETARSFGGEKLTLGLVEENRRLREWYEGFGFDHMGTKKYEFFPFTCGYMEKVL